MINQNGEMKASIRKKFDEIMAQTKTQITCAGQFDGKVKPPPGLAPDRMDVEIMGRLDAVEHARLRCLVALDTQVNDSIVQLLNTFFCFCCLNSY